MTRRLTEAQLRRLRKAAIEPAPWVAAANTYCRLERLGLVRCVPKGLRHVAVATALGCEVIMMDGELPQEVAP